jgi:signal peptidase II
LQPDALISFAGDTLRLQYAENSGAFLSLGSSLPDPWRHLVFTVLVGIFLLGLLAYTVFSREITPFAVACLSFICAGGLSNLIDRIAFDGRVVDFLNIGIGPLRTGIFNIADMAITFGALFMFVENFRRSKTSKSSKE